jgi:bifunctional non-homologous end joining protein LigD
MALDEYRRKRNFAETPEPRGRVHAARGRRQPIFVVQKHDASRLHYDFRLEIHGVLASWAVPKGPSMNPAEKRLAVRTEDHPLEYTDFEGVIPKGQYGAGTVMVWDRGAYVSANAAAMDEQLARGKIDVILDGSKLRGGFTLVKTGQRSTSRQQTKQWLLIKRRDEHADPSWNIDAPALDRSILTGRTMSEIAKDARGRTRLIDRKRD